MKRNKRDNGVKKEEKTANQENQKEIVEVLSPKKRKSETKDLLRTNRCSNVRPSQLNRSKNKKSDTVSLVVEYLPKIKVKPDYKTLQFKTNTSLKTDKASQCVSSQDSLVYLMKNKSRCNVCDSGDLNLYLRNDTVSAVKTKSLENVHITNQPRIKIIAEKFTKVKKNNLEVRQLEEKIVCVEYDVFDSSGPGFESPAQTMRVYFSVKPDATKENIIDTLPSVLKKQFSVSENSRKFDTEVYILDEKIDENKPYVEDLKVIKRSRGKKKNLFNLVSLYKLAREGPVDKNLSTIISSTKLEEYKKLIMDTTPSSMHGLSWRTVKNKSEREKSERDGYMSQSSFAKVAE